MRGLILTTSNSNRFMENNHKRGKEEAFRDTISTVDEEGKRKWLYPKKPVGKYTNYRTYLSYVLLLMLFGTPWVKIGGEHF